MQTFIAEKVCEPLSLITRLPSFDSNNIHQMFPVIVGRTCTIVKRCAPFCFKLFLFSNILDGYCHLNHVEVKPVLQRHIFFCWSHYVVDLLVCFGSCAVASHKFCWASFANRWPYSPTKCPKKPGHSFFVYDSKLFRAWGSKATNHETLHHTVLLGWDFNVVFQNNSSLN